MKRVLSKRIILFLSIAAFSLILLTITQSPKYISSSTNSESGQITFYNTNEDTEIIRLDLEPNDEYFIEYTHSLYKTKQWEFYKLGENGEMILSRMEFESADAADYYEHHTELAERSKGVFGNWVMEKDQILEEVSFRIPYLHPMTVGHENERYVLNELGESGNQVIMKAIEGR